MRISKHAHRSWIHALGSCMKHVNTEWYNVTPETVEGRVDRIGDSGTKRNTEPGFGGRRGPKTIFALPKNNFCNLSGVDKDFFYKKGVHKIIFATEDIEV